MSEEDVLSDELETGEGRKKGSALMAVVAAVVMAGGGAFAGMSFLGPTVGQALASDPTAEAGGGHGDDGHGGDGYGGGGGAELQVHVIDNLVVNPAGTNASRFLLASVALAPGELADVDDLAARDIEMRDVLLRLLGTKTVAELADIQNRSALTEEMAYALGEILGAGWVKRIYLPEFVIQ
jgi:flagellar FliL protein